MPLPLRLFTALFSVSLFFITLGSPAARAQDRIAETAVWQDDSGLLGLDAVQAQAFVPQQQPLLIKSAGANLWMRLWIQPGRSNSIGGASDPSLGSVDTQLVLLINPPYVGAVTLYDPLQPGSGPRVASLLQPLDKAEFPASNLAFVVPAGETARHVWLYFEIPRRMLVQVKALPMHVALQAENQRLKWRILSLSSLMLCLVLGLYLWWLERSLLMGLFVVRQSLVFFMILLTDGFVRVSAAEPGRSFEDLISFGVMLTVAVNTLFFQYFMRLFQVGRLGLQLLWCLLALFPIEMLLWALGRMDLAQACNSFVILVTPLLIAAMVAGKAWSTRRAQSLSETHSMVMPLTWMLPIVALALGFQVLWALHFLGWFRQDWLPVGRESYVAIVNGVLIVLVLLQYVKRSNRARNDVQLKLNVAIEQQALERNRRQESAEFLAMLTHELKTPLSVIRLGLNTPDPSPTSRQRADRAVLNMSQVIDRCAQVELLQDDAQQAPAQDSFLLHELEDVLAHCKEPNAVQLQVSSGVPRCGVNAHLFGTVFSNLLDNALKYRAPHTHADIQVLPQALDARPGVALWVRNLPGVSGWPDAQSVFRKYYRSSGARRLTGSGLGLYLAERLAQRMGGRLTYAPDSAHVQFVLWLPV